MSDLWREIRASVATWLWGLAAKVDVRVVWEMSLDLVRLANEEADAREGKP